MDENMQARFEEKFKELLSVAKKKKNNNVLDYGEILDIMADLELEQCFRMGVACASTRCITEGYKTIDKTVYRAFLDMVKIERV